MTTRHHRLAALPVLAATLTCSEGGTHPTWVRRTQADVSLPFCGLSDIGCAGDTPSCDCVSFLFTCDLTTSGCSPWTWGSSVLVIGTVMLLLCCCCGDRKSGGYEEIKSDVEAPLGVRSETRSKGNEAKDKKSSRKSKSKSKDEKKSKSSKSGKSSKSSRSSRPR